MAYWLLARSPPRPPHSGMHAPDPGPAPRCLPPAARSRMTGGGPQAAGLG